jgi:hypothetical protein
MAVAMCISRRMSSFVTMPAAASTITVAVTVVMVVRMIVVRVLPVMSP